MAPPRNYYTDSEMERMQRDAEARVREMQSRARQAVEEANQTAFTPPPNNRNRNWNSSPNMMRQRHGQNRQQQNNYQQSAPAPIKEPEPEAPAPAPAPHSGKPVTPEAEKKKTTIIEDIMSALSLDEDYLLIIGVLLILINQRADTTLILALAYLLI